MTSSVLYQSLDDGKVEWGQLIAKGGCAESIGEFAEDKIMAGIKEATKPRKFLTRTHQIKKNTFKTSKEEIPLLSARLFQPVRKEIKLHQLESVKAQAPSFHIVNSASASQLACQRSIVSAKSLVVLQDVRSRKRG